ncbi:MAG: acyl-CoA thioesterase [Paracoccaceae bacterium]
MKYAFHTSLSKDDQISFGVLDPQPVARADRVHHDECDALNHVNNTSYMVWFERLRIQFVEFYGIGTLTDPNSPRIVIRSGHIHWIAETFRDENYVITTGCTSFRRTSMTLEQAIWVDGQKRASFTCVMVLLEPDGSGKMQVPDHVKFRLIEDGAHQE